MPPRGALGGVGGRGTGGGGAPLRANIALTPSCDPPLLPLSSRTPSPPPAGGELTRRTAGAHGGGGSAHGP